MARFDYARYFGEIEPLADALREEDERVWNSTLTHQAAHHDYVLYLGCNVLRTVNLAESICAVLKSMGVDFLALGGPASCCGIVHHRTGEVETAETLTWHTLRKFQIVAPKAVLIYCPSCHARMDQVVPTQQAFQTPYYRVTEFLADHLNDLTWQHPVKRKIALHLHDTAGQPARDSAATLKILQAIPGLEVIPLVADGEWGRHCYPAQIESMGMERYNAGVQEMFQRAREAGADGLVTVYHSCYRELCGRESVEGLELTNYISLVAEGLGLRTYRQTYKQLKLEANPVAACERLQPLATERKISPAKFAATITSHFQKQK